MTDVRSAPLSPPRFDEASQDVLVYLRRTIPMGTWTVTRVDGERQIYLSVDDTDLGLSSGDWVAWADSMCQFTAGRARPMLIPDLRADPEHAAIVGKSGLGVESYVGYPLTTSDGALFGTLCGFGRTSLPEVVRRNEDLIVLLASLLSRILEADLQATAAARILEATQRRADTDGLTGLVNRNEWERLLAVEDARFRRFGDPGAVVVIDLDELKEVNDSQGHHAGDERLRLVAQLMSDVVDVPGIIARVGGDEFAILLSNLAASAVEEVVTGLRATLTDSGVSASVGHALYSMSEGLDGAWRAADAAMYTEKLSTRARRQRAPGQVAVDG